MAQRIGDKPLTNTEKQRRFRERKKAEGLKRRDTWTEKDGFLAMPTGAGGWAQITLKQMERELSGLLKEYADWEKEVVYAEIFEYAKRAIKKFGPGFDGQRAWENAEKERFNR
jgi:hypothetical protein